MKNIVVVHFNSKEQEEVHSIFSKIKMRKRMMMMMKRMMMRRKMMMMRRSKRKIK